jgi:hypothetical protein
LDLFILFDKLNSKIEGIEIINATPVLGEDFQKVQIQKI